MIEKVNNHSWNLSPAEARLLQGQLAQQVICQDQLPATVNTVAGVDVGFKQSGTIARAAVVLLSFPDLKLLDYRIEHLPVSMPYIPGLLSFRECPVILQALAKFSRQPDLLLCDGQGIAHPRRFGIACHLGILTQIPSIGVAKSRLCGNHDMPALQKGSYSGLYDGEELIGQVLRSRDGTRPLYISIGHKISLASAVNYVMACLTRYRLPETTRWADALASDRGNALKKARQTLGN